MAATDKPKRLDVRQLPEDAVSGDRSGSAVAPPDESEVAPGRAIRLYFSLALESGELVDSNFDTAPASCRLGDGNLLPGFEQALLGMRAGEEREVLLAPEQAFGLPREENVQRFPRFRFPADLPLEKGLILDFADKDGNSQPGVVCAFDSERVTIDFNHPLAGRVLLFRARLVQVGDSTAGVAAQGVAPVVAPVVARKGQP